MKQKNIEVDFNGSFEDSDLDEHSESDDDEQLSDDDDTKKKKK